MRRIIVLMVALAAVAVATARADGRDGQLPPFDPSRAVLSPDGKMWCDPNWCIFSPDAAPQLYQGGCASLCGLPRLSDAEDPDVRDWNLIQQLAGKGELASWFVEGGIFRDQPRLMFGPAFVSCPPDHPLCGRIPPAVISGTPGSGSGGGGGGGGGNPGGSAESCPVPEAIRFDPVWQVRSRPAYPIVVGQDPRREGIVYEIEVRIPPVLYRRYEKEPDVCVPVPDTDGDGKPDREGTCATQIGDPPVRWPGDLKPGQCRLVEERYPEPISGDGALAMALRASSIQWIQGELAARYPGARVRMPRILLPVRGEGRTLGDGTFVLTARVNPKPEDPGYYDVELAFRTAGTPVTAPREIRWRTPPDRPQPVYLLETTIVR